MTLTPWMSVRAMSAACVEGVLKQLLRAIPCTIVANKKRYVKTSLKFLIP